LHPQDLEQRRQYWCTTCDLGLTVSILKTKHMVSGRLVVGEDLPPIVLEGGEVEAESFHTWDLWLKALERWMQM